MVTHPVLSWRPAAPGDLAGDTELEPPRPTVAAAAPFLAVALIGLGTSLVPPYHDGTVFHAILMVALLVTAAAFFRVSLRRNHRTWVDPIAPFVMFGALAVGRDATGATGSGLGLLVGLPLIWLAMTGTRRDLRIGAVLTALVFSGPILVLGGPGYPLTDWRRAALWTAVAVFVAPVIQRTVERLGHERRNVERAGAQLDALVRGASLTSMITTDLTGVIRSFSEGAEEILGCRAEDVVGSRFADAFHDRAEIAAVAQELGVRPGLEVLAELARLEAPSRIWTYLRDDGGRRYVRLAVTELRDFDGRLTGYLGMAIDATVGQESLHALARAESRWRVLLEHLPDLTVLQLDQDSRVQAVAGAGAMRQGLRGVEGKLVSEFSKPENVAVISGLLASALDGGEATGEITGTSTGDAHEVSVTPLPITEDADGGHQFLLLARDVSKERRREQAVLRAKERAERLFADAPHGVIVLDLDGTVLDVNTAFATLIGSSTDEVVGTTLGACSSDPAGFGQYLASALANPGERAEAEWSMRTRRGDELRVALSCRVLRERANPDLAGSAPEDAVADVFLVNAVDVSERHRFEQRLTHLASHDVLTGLANRRQFDERLAAHVAWCQRYGARGALLLLDLDNFKDVNDTLGHGAGDQLIISTAALLRRGLRSTDLVARLGGDEFAILLTEADSAGAEAVAASVVERIRDFTATLDGTRRRVTASVGVVAMGAAIEHGDVLALADMTMYDAKDAGRDCYVLLDEKSWQQPRSGARLAWKGRIERALENDDFTLHLQPILDLKTNRIVSAEALVRLSDTDELVPPGRFLYIAERTGMVPALDAWVIRNAVELLSRLHRFAPDFRLEVNLSGLSIGHPNIEKTIVESLREFDVPPSTLVLEITETAAVADVENARSFAERMTSLGCKFALDDFGAGFGSFYYLKHLLFDYVKIDGEFVANVHTSAIDRTILRSIVGIAHDLGKLTVAEFVAEPAILEVVRAEGVDLAQGYLMGEPIPVDAFVDRFLQGPSGPSWPTSDRVA